MEVIRKLILTGPLFAAAALAAVSTAHGTAAADRANVPRLIVPMACEVGKTCLIQKLVDHDSGPGRRDHRCGTLTTDGHDGIDIRLRTMQDMAQGYAVLAAAGGVVLRVRDGEPDISILERGNANGRDAGNGVVIDHGNGWETQYSHLKRGSLIVRPGQRIAAGERLGLVGMSGNSEFPHLHFSVRLHGKPVDPFIGATVPAACDATKIRPGLWTTDAARALAYTPTAPITLGLASRVPPRAVADRAIPPAVEGATLPLLIWVDLIGAQDGDVQIFEIQGPDGTLLHSQTLPVSKGGLSWFAFSGKRAPAAGWQKGRYVGSYILKRDGTAIVQQQTFATMP
ncbi:MAG: M23 family metallopeptidase [Sphingomonadales bacterium]